MRCSTTAQAKRPPLKGKRADHNVATTGNDWLAARYAGRLEENNLCKYRCIYIYIPSYGSYLQSTVERTITDGRVGDRGHAQTRWELLN